MSGKNHDYLSQFGRHTPRILRRQLILQLVENYLNIDKSFDRENVENPNCCKPSIQRFHGALLFVDISGFTALSLRLNVDELKNRINDYFTKMLDIVDRHNGDVIKFAGDALFIIWETAQYIPEPHGTPTASTTGESSSDTDNAARIAIEKAVQCGKEIQEACGNHKIPINTRGMSRRDLTSNMTESFSVPAGLVRTLSTMSSMINSRSVSRLAPVGSPRGKLGPENSSRTLRNFGGASSESECVYLNVHMGVSMGLMAGLDIGADNRWEYFLIGEPMSRVAEAESQASSGDMVICPESHALLHDKPKSLPIFRRVTHALTHWSRLNLRNHSAEQSAQPLPCGCIPLKGGYCRVNIKDVTAAPEVKQKRSRTKTSGSKEGGGLENVLVHHDIEQALNVHQSQFMKEFLKYIQKSPKKGNHISEEALQASFYKWIYACLTDDIARHVHVVMRNDYIFANAVRDGAYHRAIEEQAMLAERSVSLHQQQSRTFDFGSMDTVSISVSGHGGGRLLSPLGQSSSQNLLLQQSLQGGSAHSTPHHHPHQHPRSPHHRGGGMRDSFIQLDSPTSDSVPTSPGGGNNPRRSRNTPSNNPQRRNSVDGNGQKASLAAEIRSVTVMFVKIDMTGMELSIDTTNRLKLGGAYWFLAKTINEKHADQRLLDRLQRSMEILSRAFTSHGGQMRQFIVDDKGTVCIGTFGLRGSVSDDNAAAALEAAHKIVTQLREIGLSCSIGVTVGRAYCGLVGSVSRHEYAVMGPSTNLSARLMGKAPVGGIICDIETRRRDRTHTFQELSDITAKGYKQPVRTYKPVFPDDEAFDVLRQVGSGSGKIRRVDFQLGDPSDNSPSMDSNSAMSVGGQSAKMMKKMLSTSKLTFSFDGKSEGVKLHGRQLEVETILYFAFDGLIGSSSPTNHLLLDPETPSASTNSGTVANTVANSSTRSASKKAHANLFNYEESARFIAVIGAQGMGKTAVALSVTERIASNIGGSNIHLFKSRFDPFQMGLPFNAWKPVISDMIIRMYRGRHEESKNTPNSKSFLVGLASSAVAVVASAKYVMSLLSESLQKLAPLLGYLTIVSENTSQLDKLGLSSQEKMAKSLDLLLAIIQLYVDQMKSLVFITMEDIHSYDKSSLLLMREVFNNNSGVIVMYTSRPQQDTLLSLGEDPRLLDMELDPLDKTAIGQLLDDAQTDVLHVEKKIGPELYDKIYETCGGNPFFAYEIVKSISEARITDIKAVASLQCIRIEEVICYRFDQVNNDAQTLLKIAAVACSNGSTCSLSLLSSIHEEENTRASFCASDGGDAFIHQKNAATLKTILTTESFLRVISSNGSQKQKLTRVEEKYTGISVEMILTNDYYFEFGIALEQTTIYNLLLDDQKQAIHEGIAEYYQYRRETNPEEVTVKKYLEEGFHWRRASMWHQAMVCYHYAAQHDRDDNKKKECSEVAFIMFCKTKEQSELLPDSKGVRLASELKVMFEESIDFCGQSLNESHKGGSNGSPGASSYFTLQRVFQIFNGDSNMLKIGLQLYIGMAQKRLCRCEDPQATLIFLEDAIQMMLLTKNPFLMASSYLNQLMNSMQNKRVAGESISEEQMHFCLYGFDSICFPLLSTYLLNYLIHLTASNEYTLKASYVAEKFLQMAQHQSHTVHRIQALCLNVLIQCRLGNYREALALHTELLSLYSCERYSSQLVEIYGSDRVSVTYSLMCQYHLLTGDREKAELLAIGSTAILKQLKHVYSLTVSVVRCATSLAYLGKYTEAYEIMQQYRELVQQQGTHEKECVSSRQVSLYLTWLSERMKHSTQDLQWKDLASPIELGDIMSDRMVRNGDPVRLVLADMCAVKVELILADVELSSELRPCCESMFQYMQHVLVLQKSLSLKVLFLKAFVIQIASQMIKNLGAREDCALILESLRRILTIPVINQLRSAAQNSQLHAFWSALNLIQRQLHGDVAHSNNGVYGGSSIGGINNKR